MKKPIKAIIFDYGYTIYDPDLEKFQVDALPVLQTLSGKFKLILVSKTEDTEKRLRQIEEVGFDSYFDFIQVIRKDEKKNFENILGHYSFSPQEYLVVGDRITSEITEGNRLDMQTCRFIYGPEKDLIPNNSFEIADYSIEKLSDLINLVI